MNQANPFLQSMVRMKFPPDSGGTLTIGGFLLKEDEDGCVDLPKNYVSEAQSHGLTVAPPQVAKTVSLRK